MPQLSEMKRILVPISGNSTDEEVITLACSLAKKPKAEVYVVYVIEVERGLPLDVRVESKTGEAEEALSRAEDIATEQGCDIETDLLQAREAGPGIVDEAVDTGADLIIMATSYGSHTRAFDVDMTVPYVLREAPCRVLLYRAPKW